MSKLHRATQDALRILKVLKEDISDDRKSHRNDVRQMVDGSLILGFSDYEHFLEKYGYLTQDRRTDSYHLTQVGLEVSMMRENKLKSLNEDAQYHFQKEIEAQRFAPAAHILGGRRFDQHYIRFEGIGRGGIGSVWRGEHLKTGRPVAIKTLEGINDFANLGRKSTLKRSLERCLRSVSKLNHPFITAIHDLNLHHTPPYYVMPLCEGGSLRDLLQKGPISPEVGLNWFIQIALGLHHAHQEGVMHLDLKPENVLIDHRGNVSIFDFGMSRTMARQLSQVGRQSYVGFGSVAYMPPELLRNPHLEDPTIDIYALGLILYEILIGELPGRRSPMPSEVIQGLPEPVDQLFDQMAQDIPQRRLQSMDEVLELINQIPDFKRLSQKSMVMIFNQTPLDLPGLVTLHLDEPEEWDLETPQNRSLDSEESLATSPVERTSNHQTHHPKSKSQSDRSASDHIEGNETLSFTSAQIKTTALIEAPQKEELTPTVKPSEPIDSQTSNAEEQSSSNSKSDLDQRYQMMDELLDDLDDAMSIESVQEKSTEGLDKNRGQNTEDIDPFDNEDDDSLYDDESQSGFGRLTSTQSISTEMLTSAQGESSQVSHQHTHTFDLDADVIEEVEDVEDVEEIEEDQFVLSSTPNPMPKVQKSTPLPSATSLPLSKPALTRSPFSNSASPFPSSSSFKVSPSQIASSFSTPPKSSPAFSASPTPIIDADLDEVDFEDEDQTDLRDFIPPTHSTPSSGSFSTQDPNQNKKG